MGVFRTKQEDGYGTEVNFIIDDWDKYTIVEFYGKGLFQVVLEK